MRTRATILDRLTCRLALWHAGRVHARFLRTLRAREFAQQAALQRALRLVCPSEYGRALGLERVRTAADFRRVVPLHTYEDLRPVIERVARGESGALFRRGVRLHMFATTSGTTAQPKFIPVTSEFIADYRRAWNVFGLKLLLDHPEAILRPILQSSGRYDTGRTPSGVPHGAITGLVARTQKSLVRKYYVGHPDIAGLTDPLARYYTLMRLGVVRDVAWAITANPATLIAMARVADEHSEALIRDVHDGTLAAPLTAEATWLRERLADRLLPNPQRAAELEALRRRHGCLRPCDYWRLSFLVCWTGGSMGHYLDRLRSWWGDLPVRDPGLLASEGRITIPFQDDTPIGVLDPTAAFFEFIPAEELAASQPPTLTAGELVVGRDYGVVLTNTAGMIRYRLDDVVRVHGWLHELPLLEFLHRGGRVASIAGEKLTENQVVAAARIAFQASQINEFDFVIAPTWGDPPFYRLSSAEPLPPRFLDAFDKALAEQNEEYQSRRKSRRLGPLQSRPVDVSAFQALDQKLLTGRRTAAEQYKRPVLLTLPGEDDELMSSR